MKADSFHPLAIANKSSKNSSKSREKYYYASTKKQISKKFKEKKAERSLKVAQDMAFKNKRSKERKMALARARKEEKANMKKCTQPTPRRKRGSL